MRLDITDWVFYQAPIWLLTIGVFAVLLGAMEVGHRAGLRRANADEPAKEDHSRDGYIVSGVLGLLALLLGFTFSLAIDRYDARRSLVLQETNSIGTTLLRAQTFEEPYRSRLRSQMIEYIDMRLATARSTSTAQTASLLAETDKTQIKMWSTTVEAVNVRRDPVSTAFMESMNETLGLANSRRQASRAHVPSQVFTLLLLYMTISSGVLGYVLADTRRVAAGMFMLLLTLALVLIVDIDGPARGSVVESQTPMQQLKASVQPN